MQTLSDKLLAESAVAGATSNVAGKTSILSGSGTFVYSMFTSEYLFAAIGAIVAIATFLVNSHYRRRQFELEQQRFKLDEEMKHKAEERKLMETQARIEALRSGNTTVLGALHDTHL